MARRKPIPMGKASRKRISAKIRLLRKEGVPRKEAIARGISKERRRKKGKR